MAYSIKPLSAIRTRRWEEFNARSRQRTPLKGRGWKNTPAETLRLCPGHSLSFKCSRVVSICPSKEQSLKFPRGWSGIEGIGQISKTRPFFRGCSDMYVNTHNPAIPEKNEYTNNPDETGNTRLPVPVHFRVVFAKAAFQACRLREAFQGDGQAVDLFTGQVP